jgi:hypothetical protein
MINFAQHFKTSFVKTTISIVTHYFKLDNSTMSKIKVSRTPLSEVIMEESDFNNDGIIDSKTTITKTFDKQGSLVRSVFEIDSNADGKIDARDTTNNTYDKHGNLIRSVFESDNNGDGKIDFRTSDSKTFNNQGKLTSLVSEIDNNADGQIDFKGMSSNTYDNRGNLTISVAEVDFDGGGSIDLKITTTNTYNHQNKLTSSVIQSPIQNNIINNTYDNQGNLILAVSEDNFNGSISKTSTSNTYDKQGKLTSSVAAIDNNANGTIDSINTTKNTYNKQGKLTSSIEGVDFEADGKVDSQTTTRNTYNNQGKVTRSVIDRDFDADGKTDVRESDSNTYDKQGKLIRSVSVFEGPRDDGTLETRSTSTNTNTYDKRGKLASSFTEVDVNGDGIIDTRRTTIATYDGRDQLCGLIVTGKSGDKSDRLTNYKVANLVGGNGNNLVTGTVNSDLLTGGNSADVFLLAPNSGMDTITNFQIGKDLIGLSEGISFGQISFNKDQILFEGKTLATLTGIQTSTLTVNNFTVI